MFVGEQIHEDWINDCVSYLKSIFGDTISGQTVVEYGFGRGNWALAFKKLGAKKVIAVDASQTAVDSFRRYIQENDVDGIEAIVGNVDDEVLEFSCDIVFLYGILHHLKDPVTLVKYASSWLADPTGRVLLYAYDKSSLREIVVSRCRSMAVDALNDWTGWQGTLHPLARHRAADDLVAPFVSFWSPKDICEILDEAGLKCIAQAKDFSDFMGTSFAPEFDPYVLLVAPDNNTSSATSIKSNRHEKTGDHLAIVDALDLITNSKQLSNKTEIAIGIFNTLFCGGASEKFENRMFYLWCYLVHIITMHPQTLEITSLRPTTRCLFRMTIKRFSSSIPDADIEQVKSAYPVLSRKVLKSAYRL